MNSCIICIHYLNEQCTFRNGCVLSKRFNILPNDKLPHKKEMTFTNWNR